MVFIHLWTIIFSCEEVEFHPDHKIENCMSISLTVLPFFIFCVLTINLVKKCYVLSCWSRCKYHCSTHCASIILEIYQSALRLQISKLSSTYYIAYVHMQISRSPIKNDMYACHNKFHCHWHNMHNHYINRQNGRYGTAALAIVVYSNLVVEGTQVFNRQLGRSHYALGT